MERHALVRICPRAELLPERAEVLAKLAANLNEIVSAAATTHLAVSKLRTQ